MNRRKWQVLTVIADITQTLSGVVFAKFRVVPESFSSCFGLPQPKNQIGKQPPEVLF